MKFALQDLRCCKWPILLLNCIPAYLPRRATSHPYPLDWHRIFPAQKAFLTRLIRIKTAFLSCLCFHEEHFFLILENYMQTVQFHLQQGYFVTKIVLTYCEKNCSSEREKLLKFKAEGQEFAKNVEITRTIYSNIEQILVTKCFFNLFLKVSPI